MTIDTPPCSQQSLDAGEPLFGTAPTETSCWVLLEEHGAWAPKPLDSPGLAGAWRAALTPWLARRPHTRFQLVRGAVDDQAPAVSGARRLFIGVSDDTGSALWERELDDAPGPAIVASLDLQLFRPGTPPPPPARLAAHPIVLVCTHGRRDACCARLGVPVFRELEADFGADRVWQTSHVGGHRFAANVVLLPHGYVFGRLDVAAARRVVRGYFAGRLTDLDRFRGRSPYPAEVQAAEFWLRQGGARYRVDGLELVRREVQADGRVEVTFKDTATDELHALTIVREVTADLASTSCGEAPEPVVRHRLESYRHHG